MGKTHFVTIPASEYACLQRIVGIASATVGIVPNIYSRETTPLRHAVLEYERLTGRKVEHVRL